MSVLNSANDGTPSVFCVLYNLLDQRGPMSRELINKLCAPTSLVDQIKSHNKTPEDRINDVLNTGQKIGLFSELNEDIEVSSKFKGFSKDINSLRKMFLELFLDDSNNNQLFNPTGQGSSDFTRCVSWFLSQDIWNHRFSEFEDIQTLIIDQLAGEHELIIQNASHFSFFKRWASFLGLIRLEPGGGQNPLIIPDPTKAIKIFLPDILKKNEQIEAPKLIDKLAEKLPVIDGGNYRKQLEKKLNAGNSVWIKLPKNQLSQSLSFALVRLMKSGILEAEDKADAEKKVTLTARDNKSWIVDSPRLAHGVCSHFTLK